MGRPDTVDGNLT